MSTDVSPVIVSLDLDGEDGPTILLEDIYQNGDGQRFTHRVSLTKDEFISLVAGDTVVTDMTTERA